MVTMKDKELLKLLLKNGQQLSEIKGSHHILTKNRKIEVIPVHGKDMKIGLLTKILKRTGLKQKE